MRRSRLDLLPEVCHDVIFSGNNTNNDALNDFQVLMKANRYRNHRSRIRLSGHFKRFWMARKTIVCKWRVFHTLISGLVDLVSCQMLTSNRTMNASCLNLSNSSFQPNCQTSSGHGTISHTPISKHDARIASLARQQICSPPSPQQARGLIMCLVPPSRLRRHVRHKAMPAARCLPGGALGSSGTPIQH